MKFALLQTLIDRIRGKIFALDSMVSKYECFSGAADYHTVAFGSSHMDSGYITSDNEINMGSPSQDLYYSYNLYRLLNKPCLKRVLLTFSVFTPGDFLIKSELNQLCVLFKLLYGIPYQDESLASKYKLPSMEKYCLKRIQKYRNKRKRSANDNACLFCDNKTNRPKRIERIETRALKHYKINRKKEQNMDYFLKFLEDTKQNSQELYIILPPATTYYKNVLPSSDIIFQSAYDVCKNYPHVKIINLYDSKEFSNDDFVDGDHLNYSGRKKFTDLVHNHINGNNLSASGIQG